MESEYDFSVMDRNSRQLEDLSTEIKALEESVKGHGHRVAEAHPERSLLGFQAEWHIRGVLYHLCQVFHHHALFVGEVSGRAGTGASVLFMYAPSYQEMLFEFYTLVNLCRVALDNLRLYLKPLFMSGSDELPKSMRDVLKGSTNCPVYMALVGQPLVDYLLDLRNCLVHYRSFATSDNAYVVEEGAEISGVSEREGLDSYLAAMARADFRRVGENAISVNVCLPDRIFEADEHGGTRLAKFTYHERWNLISTARNFVKLATMSLKGSLECLTDVDQPVFEFSAKKRNMH
ncbi:MAG: hypothetical protein ACLPND_15760 [Candidatus Korobacteraceae bacterium]